MELVINYQDAEKLLIEDGMNIRKISADLLDEDLCIKAVASNPQSIQIVPDKLQTQLVKAIAIRKDPFAIEFVKEKDNVLSLLAVKRAGKVIGLIENPSYDACMAAIEQDPQSILKIKDATEEMYINAVKANPHILDYIPEQRQTESICAAAVEVSGATLKYCTIQTPKIIEKALKRDTTAAVYIDQDRVDELCEKAVKEDPYLIKYIKQTEFLSLTAVRSLGGTLEVIKDPSDAVKIAAIKNKPSVICLLPIEDRVGDIAMEAVKGDPKTIKYIDNQTPEICIEALKQDLSVINIIKSESRTSEVLSFYNTLDVPDETEQISLSTIIQKAYGIVTLDGCSSNSVIKFIKHYDKSFGENGIIIGFDGNQSVIALRKEDIDIIVNNGLAMNHTTYGLSGEIEQYITKYSYETNDEYLEKILDSGYYYNDEARYRLSEKGDSYVMLDDDRGTPAYIGDGDVPFALVWKK